MPDRTVEDELRHEVRRACAAARGAGTVAARLAAAEDDQLGRWWQLGLLHVGLPEHLGGAGGDATLPFAVAEECARDLLTPPVLLDGLRAAQALAVLADGSADARLELTQLLDGDVPAVCWPGVCGTTSGPVRAGADRLVLVRSDVDGALRLGVVDLADASRGGSAEPSAASIDPTRPSVRLDLAAAPMRVLRVLDPAQAGRLRACWLLLAAADSLGAMQANLDLALEHVRSRAAFGRPIGAFQAVRHRCVDCYVDVETTRAAVAGASAAWAQGRDDALADVLVAASHAVDAQIRVAEAVVLLHGALGFTYECDAQFYLRRAYAGRAVLPPVRELRIELATLSDQ